MVCVPILVTGGQGNFHGKPSPQGSCAAIKHKAPGVSAPNFPRVQKAFDSWIKVVLFGWINIKNIRWAAARTDAISARASALSARLA